LLIGIKALINEVPKYFFKIKFQHPIYMADKDSLFKNLYYDELGYQSISNLYKEAKRRQHNDIKICS